MNVKADFTGAVAKTKTLKALPKAHQYQLTRFGTETVRELKRSATKQQKSGKGRKTGFMARNTGMELDINQNRYRLTLGTGLRALKKVIYASIQDKGGVIRAKDKLLTVPLAGVMGRAANYPDAFVIKSKKGNVLLVRREKGKLRLLFALKKEVTIPGSGWFSDIIAQQRPVLDGYLSKPKLLAVAAKLSGGSI